MKIVQTNETENQSGSRIPIAVRVGEDTFTDSTCADQHLQNLNLPADQQVARLIWGFWREYVIMFRWYVLWP